MAPDFSREGRSLRFTVGDEELVIRRKYEVASIANDILVAIWFVVGSILFFSSSTETVGTWFFLVGSIQLLIRPLIRLARHVHLTRVGNAHAPADSPEDF